MAKKKSLEETINQEVQQTQDYMSQASQLFREAWELQKQVPMWDNYDLSRLDDKAKEALQKQAQLLRDIAEQKFKNAQQIIDMASKEQAKDDEEKHLENGKNVKEIAPNASHFKLNLSEKIHEIALDVRNSVKETFNRWKEAVELTGQKLETIKDHAVEYRQAVTNAKKVAASIKTQDKMFNADIKMLEAQKEAILNRMKENEVAVMKMDDKAELLYEKAMRQNERAYSLELLKAGMTGIAKNMFGKKEEVMPPIMDYSTPKDPAAGQIKDLQDIAIATVKENRAMENELRSIEKEIALKTILHGQIEIPEGISKEDYNKATNRIRDKECDDLIKDYENDNEIELGEEQKEAVKKTLKNRVSIITGGPGRGKTTIEDIIIKGWKAKGGKTILLAPTGRAAQRMTQATEEEAKTIQRKLLAYETGCDEESYFLPTLVLVDEMSMCTLQLLARLINF